MSITIQNIQTAVRRNTVPVYQIILLDTYTFHISGRDTQASKKQGRCRSIVGTVTFLTLVHEILYCIHIRRCFARIQCIGSLSLKIITDPFYFITIRCFPGSQEFISLFLLCFFFEFIDHLGEIIRHLKVILLGKLGHLIAFGLSVVPELVGSKVVGS